MPQSNMKEQARRQFDSWAHSYDRSVIQGLLFEPSYNLLTETLIRWVGSDGRRRRLLDVGCGTGTLAARVVGAGLPFEVVGLDYSETMCVKAEEKSRRVGAEHRIRFVNGDSEHLPFADRSFDAVTCSNSFHHYPHQQATIADMKRVLAPGGILVLLDGFRDNVIGWFIFDVCVARVEKSVVHASWRAARSYLQRAGFARIRQRKAGVLVPVLLTVAEVGD